jgi:diacylglycerol kinase (ATP)
MAKDEPKMLFIVNPASGKQKIDWTQKIRDSLNGKQPFEIYELPVNGDESIIRDQIERLKPSKVIAVGGDGTVKLVAECLLHSDMELGILPAGSANGMARELEIPDDPQAAIDIVLHGKSRLIHLVKVNDELCIHLSDIGFNAWVVKKFEENDTRGMWGYMKATWNVLWRHRRMKLCLNTDQERVYRYAVMAVIANASKYGNGVVINPAGSLYDDLFEVVVVRKISLIELFKMRFTNKPFNSNKTEVFQTKSLEIISKHYVHFQVDGETKGKVKQINAELLARALKVILPNT